MSAEPEDQERLPAPEHTVPGPTYDNPNEDEEYTPPPVPSEAPDDDEEDPDDVGLDILEAADGTPEDDSE